MQVYLVVKQYEGRWFPVHRSTRNQNEVLFVFKNKKSAEKLAEQTEHSDLISINMDTTKWPDPTLSSFDHQAFADEVVKHLNRSFN